MAHFLALANHKGGVGRTAIAVHLAFALANLGQRVLLLDADRQADASIWLGCRDHLPGFLDILRGRAIRPNLLQPRPSLWLLPPGKASPPRTLHQPAIEKMRQTFSQLFDWILLDTPSPLCPHLLNALALADSIACPVSLSLASIRGLRDLLLSLHLLPQNHRPDLALVIPNMVDRRQRRLIAQVLQPLQQLGPAPISPTLPTSSAIPLSYPLGKTVFETDPAGTAARAYRNLAAYILQKMDQKGDQNAGQKQRAGK